jgi:hypothetical protein
MSLFSRFRRSAAERAARLVRIPAGIRANAIGNIHEHHDRETMESTGNPIGIVTSPLSYGALTVHCRQDYRQTILQSYC